jgi:hypothetical protein
MFVLLGNVFFTKLEWTGEEDEKRCDENEKSS